MNNILCDIKECNKQATIERDNYYYCSKCYRNKFIGYKIVGEKNE